MAKNSRQYVAAVSKDPHSEFGVAFPDLPGCYSGGETLGEAISMAHEAAALHIEGLIAEGLEVPEPGEHADVMEVISAAPDEWQGTAVWILVDVDMPEHEGPAQRLNISLPEKLVNRIDAAARRENQSRSGYLATAAREKLAGSSAEQ